MSRFVCVVLGHRWATQLHLHGRVLHARCDRCGYRTASTLNRTEVGR